jgi:hypothetical protein
MAVAIIFNSKLNNKQTNLLEKVTSPWLEKSFPAFYDTERSLPL